MVHHDSAVECRRSGRIGKRGERDWGYYRLRLDWWVTFRIFRRCIQLTIILSSDIDYVFDGSAPPYIPSSPTNPLQTYGVTKRDGEISVLAADGANAVVLRVPVL